MFSGTELGCEGNETEYTASNERENGVGAVSHIIDGKAFTDDNICGVAHEENHAGSIGGGKLSNEPRYRIELDRISIVDQEGGAGKDDGVISAYDTQQGEHEVKVNEKLLGKD